jgi:hypothetical protein
VFGRRPTASSGCEPAIDIGAAVCESFTAKPCGAGAGAHRRCRR